MKKRFKKIYVEITNNCNLKCSFCSEIKKVKKEMSLEEFKIVIEKIKDYTNYIYLHIKGEPLIHSKLDDILSICDSNNIFVNITTNGTLLKEREKILLTHKSIRQINISLHSENNKNNYFKDVFEVSKSLSTKMFINYRIWTLNNLVFDKESTNIVNKIIEYYNLSNNFIENLKKNKNLKINTNTYVSINNYYSGEKITLDSIVLDKTLSSESEVLNNYIKEIIPTLSYDMKKEVLNNILNGEDTLTSILINEDESDIFVYQLNNILKDKYDIKLDKLSKEDETMLQKLFLDNISDNDTNIFENSKSILSGLSYYKHVAKKNNISLSDLMFDNDELLLESTKELYENIGTDLLTDTEINNFREYIDNISKSNNISSLDLLSNSKYISLIKGGISYES